MIDLHGFEAQLAAGALLTVELTAASFGVGIVLGLLGAAAKLSRNLVLRSIGEVYTTVVRGVPELLVVLIVFFGLSLLVQSIARGVGYDAYIEVTPFVAGMIALGLTFGAYATEVFRGAFLAVPKGQAEAARALGMSRWQTFQRILLPQVWRFALPGLGNLFLVLLKDTALVSVVGLDELMRKSAIAVSYTKEPFTFYLAAAVIYLCMTAISMAGIHLLERRVERGVRRAV